MNKIDLLEGKIFKGESSFYPLNFIYKFHKSIKNFENGTKVLIVSSNNIKLVKRYSLYFYERICNRNYKNNERAAFTLHNVDKIIENSEWVLYRKGYTENLDNERFKKIIGD